MAGLLKPNAIVLATTLAYELELLSLYTGLINKYQQEILSHMS